ncbi:MAG: hypothetical protein D6736_00200 [Nitrospinota bacterium]|nr:MAG: hypothetical protein D6736_00200 [Nitrospinota bacterium]
MKSAARMGAAVRLIMSAAGKAVVHLVNSAAVFTAVQRNKTAVEMDVAVIHHAVVYIVADQTRSARMGYASSVP